VPVSDWCNGLIASIDPTLIGKSSSFSLCFFSEDFGITWQVSNL
jgi:hypothetical protein